MPREEEHRRFLDWLIEQVIALQIDAVLIAGDVFDTANPPQSAEALQALRTHVVGAAASDPAQRLLPLPSPEAPRVVIALLPFLRDRDIRQDKSGEMAAEIRKAITTGQREIHIGGLGSVEPSIYPESFAYMALGHLHRPQSIDKSDRIRYSGSPILLSFSEANHEKEMRLLEITETGIS
jgi:exonuclease SbcD